MVYSEFLIRDQLDPVRFFGQSAVKRLIEFEPRESWNYTQVLCNIGPVNHVVVCIMGNTSSVTFLGSIKPGDLEEIAAHVEFAGGRLFDSRRRVYGRKNPA